MKFNFMPFFNFKTEQIKDKYKQYQLDLGVSREERAGLFPRGITS
jgi:hypothetical protein